MLYPASHGYDEGLESDKRPCNEANPPWTLLKISVKSPASQEETSLKYTLDLALPMCALQRSGTRLLGRHTFNSTSPNFCPSMATGNGLLNVLFIYNLMSTPWIQLSEHVSASGCRQEAMAKLWPPLCGAPQPPAPCPCPTPAPVLPSTCSACPQRLSSPNASSLPVTYSSKWQNGMSYVLVVWHDTHLHLHSKIAISLRGTCRLSTDHACKLSERHLRGSGI